MKSFSSTSFANAPAEVLETALAAVRENPQALFTDFQWFLFEGKDTVFYTAYSKIEFDKDGLTNLVAGMVALAPQLTHGFVGARPGQPFPKHLIDAITSVETVDEFDGYPDKWISKSVDIFERQDLPLFRVMVAVRRNGPDAQGRAALIQVRSSHALMEGSDSALLTRSANSAHGTMSDKANKVGFGAKLSGKFSAWMMTWTYIILANLLAPKEKPWGFTTLALKRHRLRLLANRIGVRQRRHGSPCRPYTQWSWPRPVRPVVDCSGWSRFARSSRCASWTSAGRSGTESTGVQGSSRCRNSTSHL